MNPPLTPRQTFTLYGCVVAVLFVGYLGVLSAGQQGWVAGQDSGSGVTRVQSLTAEDDEAMVDFYQELDQAKAEASATRTAPGPALRKRAERPAQQPLPVESQATTTSGPRWVVQVGAFSKREEAAQLLLSLKAKQLPGRIVDPAEAGLDDLFRVWVGSDYGSADEARTMEARLKSHGIACYIKKLF